MKPKPAAGGRAVEWTGGGGQIVRFGGARAGAQRAAKLANGTETAVIGAFPVILWDEVGAEISCTIPV